MSRAEGKTKIQAEMDKLNKRKDYLMGVNGTYSLNSQPDSSDFAADYAAQSKSDWTGNGRSGWLSAWKTANSSLTKDESWNMPADTSTATHADHLQHLFRKHEETSSNFTTSDKPVSDIVAELATLQTDMDDILACEAAGDVDQVDPS